MCLSIKDPPPQPGVPQAWWQQGNLPSGSFPPNQGQNEGQVMACWKWTPEFRGQLSPFPLRCADREKVVLATRRSWMCRGVGEQGRREVERRHTCKPPTNALKEAAEKEMVTSAMGAVRGASQGTRPESWAQSARKRFF
uniref:Uncharacterized protein n=1 Tax=Molossus molossus TaxID=27622 RepID=A0A7J8FYJ4_MOLMO|nr:hypothetical protein HJG59_008143 [Molossus molossus]